MSRATVLASLNADDDCPHFEPHLTAYFGTLKEAHNAQATPT